MIFQITIKIILNYFFMFPELIVKDVCRCCCSSNVFVAKLIVDLRKAIVPLLTRRLLKKMRLKGLEVPVDFVQVSRPIVPYQIG